MAERLLLFVFLLCVPFGAVFAGDEIEPSSGLPWSLATADLERYGVALNNREYRTLNSIRNQTMSPRVWPRGRDEAILVQSSLRYVLMTRSKNTSDAFAGARHRTNAIAGARTLFPRDYPGLDWRLIEAIALGLAGELENPFLTCAIATLAERGLTHSNPIVQLKSALALHFGGSADGTWALQQHAHLLPPEVTIRLAKLVQTPPLAYSVDSRCSGLIQGAFRRANQRPPFDVDR